MKSKGLVGLVMFALVLAAGIFWYENKTQQVTQTSNNFIKWVDFNASKEAMKKACLMDIESYESEKHLDWITLLAYAAVRGAGSLGANRQITLMRLRQNSQTGRSQRRGFGRNTSIFHIIMKRIPQCLAAWSVSTRSRTKAVCIRKSTV